MHVCKCTAVHVYAQILSASFFFSTCVRVGMEMCVCVLYIYTDSVGNYIIRHQTLNTCSGLGLGH